ncbi:hypothetical protein HK100_011845 [Physocladia obscura]|uniref:Uncharacterized protein n=1 Tax=Physocladia obscura TaxID=109957 RepID=A0AAD5T245_9FUNG|nr:hypothetical protein HK100_011845 [Physocladia obscura]
MAASKILNARSTVVIERSGEQYGLLKLAEVAVDNELMDGDDGNDNDGVNNVDKETVGEDGDVAAGGADDDRDTLSFERLFNEQGESNEVNEVGNEAVEKAGSDRDIVDTGAGTDVEDEEDTVSFRLEVDLLYQDKAGTE